MISLELNKIYNNDFLSNNLPNQSIDLCFTDPPYKLTSGGISGLMKDGILDPSVYDNKGEFFKTLKFEDWIPEVYRVLKKDADFYIMVNDKNLKDCLNIVEKCGFKVHNVLVWYKGNHTPNRWYMKSCEFIVYAWKGKAKPINNKGSLQINMTKCKMGNRFHPTEKPVELVEYYIVNSSQEGDLILDPFIGSGTTAIASYKLNRNFIGYEIDSKYFKVTNERLQQVVNQ